MHAAFRAYAALVARTALIDVYFPERDEAFLLSVCAHVFFVDS